MAQRRRAYIHVTAIIGCVVGFSQPTYAQGWYGGPYSSQAPRTTPGSGYTYPAPAQAAPRAPNNAIAQELDTLRAQLAASYKQFQDTRNELQHTQMLLQQARAALEREQSSRHQRSSLQHTFSNQLRQFSTQQDEVYAEMRRLSDEVRALKAPLIESQAQMADIATIASALNEERNRLQRTLGGQDERHSALRSELQTARDALEQARSDAARIRDERIKAERQTRSCETQVTDLSSSLLDTSRDSDNARQALAQAIAARDSLQTELSSCAVKLAQVQAEQSTNSSPAESASPTADKLTSPATQPQTETVAMMTAETIPHPVDNDHDGDGIPNSADSCPETPHGTVVGPTGCNLPLPLVLEGVSFLSNSHELNEESFVVLNSVAGLLARHPQLRLEVADFTQTRGTAAANPSLSQRRAETIRNYLINGGVNADSLTARGYGNERPVSNKGAPELFLQGRPVTLRQID